MEAQQEEGIEDVVSATADEADSAEDEAAAVDEEDEA
jgi:hypothetical protein